MNFLKMYLQALNLRYSLIAILLFSFGCAYNRSIDQTVNERFRSVIQEETVQGKIYKDLELLLSVSATFTSPEVRNAYIDKYVQDRLLSSAEREKISGEEEKKAAEGLEFIVCVFSDQESWNNLEDKDSIWTVTLTNETGNPVKPVRISRIDPIPVYIADFIPGMNTWKKVYSVVYPAKIKGSDTLFMLGETRNSTLEFRSAIGHLSLTF